MSYANLRDDDELPPPEHRPQVERERDEAISRMQHALEWFRDAEGDAAEELWSEYESGMSVSYDLSCTLKRMDEAALETRNV